MSDTPPNVPNETTIFESLERLACKPGYAHVLAALCYKHKFLPSNSILEFTDGSKAGLGEKLVRTEIGILVGLFSKSKRDLSIPNTEILRNMIDETELLLSKLHESTMPELKLELTSSPSANESTEKGEVAFLREAMIYSGESGYTFQYRNLSVEKYANDDQWLVDNKGFKISEACAVYDSILESQRQRLVELRDESKPYLIDHQTLLTAYIVSADALAEHSELSLKTVPAVIEAFSLRGDNDKFSGISEFNEANAAPLIPIGDSTFIVFDLHALAESLYESPFYWMMADEIYSDLHTVNRGRFTEDFCARRLRDVFGKDKVYSNIKIPQSKATTITEIDVLAHFADRVVLIQAKSKRLTLDARRGKIGAIECDFEKGVQHACDQGYDGASLLFDRSIRETLADQYGIRLPDSIKEVFLLSVLSDHYPALSIQVQCLLSRRENSSINTPLVIDVFALDVITEFLDSPLYFLSYLKRRSQYSERISSAQELTVFAHHLSNNLWVDSAVDLFSLDDGFCRELDHVFIRRRCFDEIRLIPEGILTIFRNTTVGSILQSMRARDDEAIFELGLRLLEMSSQALREFDEGCSAIILRTVEDGITHDFSILMSEGKFGITVHCNLLPEGTARNKLLDHCQRRKYERRSECWFGLCLSPFDLAPRFGVHVHGPWEYSSAMAQKMKTLGTPRKRLGSFLGVARFGRKVGRNDPCPCGSGRKYKRCCL